MNPSDISPLDFVKISVMNPTKLSRELVQPFRHKNVYWMHLNQKELIHFDERSEIYEKTFMTGLMSQWNNLNGTKAANNKNKHIK